MSLSFDAQFQAESVLNQYTSPVHYNFLPILFISRREKIVHCSTIADVLVSPLTASKTSAADFSKSLTVSMEQVGLIQLNYLHFSEECI